MHTTSGSSTSDILSFIADINSFHRMRNYDTNSSASQPNEESKENCSTGDLLGPFGLLVQGLLAFLAFTCLIGKCFCSFILLMGLNYIEHGIMNLHLSLHVLSVMYIITIPYILRQPFPMQEQCTYVFPQ